MAKFLYAGYDEHEALWPTTIRKTEAEVIVALRELFDLSDDCDLLSEGYSIGRFDLKYLRCDVHPKRVEWVAGFKAPKKLPEPTEGGG